MFAGLAQVTVPSIAMLVEEKRYSKTLRLRGYYQINFLITHRHERSLGFLRGGGVWESGERERLRRRSVGGVFERLRWRRRLFRSEMSDRPVDSSSPFTATRRGGVMLRDRLEDEVDDDDDIDEEVDELLDRLLRLRYLRDRWRLRSLVDEDDV